MQTLIQGRRKSLGMGEPIPTPFKKFAYNGIHFRRGSLSIIAAAPGGGKSALAQNIVQRGNDEGLVSPALYMSADSDAAQMFQRSAAMATGYDLAGVERLMKEGGQEMLEERVRHASSHVQYSFESTHTTETVMEEVTAYALVHGSYPEVIVMDNLMNLDAGEDDEWRNLGEASFDLLNLARDTGAAVIALHHVGGTHEQGDRPMGLDSLRGKVSKLPALVLTMHKVQESAREISVVKNRTAKADSSGNHGVSLAADLARMTFND